MRGNNGETPTGGGDRNSGRAGKAVLWIIVTVVGITVLGRLSGDPDPRDAEDPNQRRARMIAWADFEAAYREQVRTGRFHSVEPALHRVRIDPVTWTALPLKTKQELVLGFRGYFYDRDGWDASYFLSDRNDTVLGQYTGSGGLRIFY